MSSVQLIGLGIFVFVITALLYFQSRTQEPFADLNRATWNPSKPPVAGRPYNPSPDSKDYSQVPADLNRDRAPYSAPTGSGSIPLSQQRPSMIPGGGTQTMPREALAQIKDLRELDSKITTWLDAASQKERDQPGSLTSAQRQERIMLMARLRSIRDQVGTGLITDTWKRVADETLNLRNENQGWQQVSPSLAEVNEFGVGSPADAFLTPSEFTQFYSIFNAAIREMSGLAQPDPLQKVRLQQLQVLRQELTDLMNQRSSSSSSTSSSSLQSLPIKMGAAQLFLKQMLKPDQPLPSLFSIDATPTDTHTNFNNSSADVLSDLQNMSWSLNLRIFHDDPVTQDLKAATATLMNQLKNKQITPQEARSHVVALKQYKEPESVMSQTQPTQTQLRQSRINPNANNQQQHQQQHQEPVGLTSPLIQKARTLCKQIREAFPYDAAALGCVPDSRISDAFNAETVINTVCNRLRYSVPTVTPEQFGCPVRAV